VSEINQMNVETKHQTPTKGLAMVVDDLASNREILIGLLTIEGYQTIAAENGLQAIEFYKEHQPDIIFMDAMMPVMDGYEATTQIKALAGTHFVPIMFLSGMSETEAMVKCIEAGGDDFINKPFKREILRAKVKSMERIRDLSRTVEELHRKLEIQNRVMHNEQVVAEQIYRRAITDENSYSDHIDFLIRPVSIFGGDMMLTAFSPDGTLNVVLGDFTGHGLTAAIGMLPAAEVFRVMTAQGEPMQEIIAAINEKLFRLLPTGMFMAGCFVTIDKNFKKVSVWNAGMPEVLILGVQDENECGATIKHRIASQFLSLGILHNFETDSGPVSLVLNEGDRILLASDGVSEAVNMSGEEFGTQRLEKAANCTKFSLNSVMTAVDEFRGDTPFGDDVSMVEIHCVPGLFKTMIEAQSFMEI
jgi:CheY-like chemotaxis protein